MEDFELALGEPSGCFIDNTREFAPVEVASEIWIRTCFRDVVGGNCTRTCPCLRANFITCNGVHPCPELAVIAKLTDARVHDEHRVVHHVGCKRRVAQLPTREVIQLVGVHVVERRQPLRVTGA